MGLFTEAKKRDLYRSLYHTFIIIAIESMGRSSIFKYLVLSLVILGMNMIFTIHSATYTIQL